MKEIQYKTFVQDHWNQIAAKIKELDNFNDADISILKTQISRAINIRRHMPVVPFDEIKELMIGYLAITLIEDEMGFKY
jgi:hypothetical protein